MSNTVFNRKGVKELKRVVDNAQNDRAQQLAGGLLKQLNALHSIDFYPTKEVEGLLLQQQQYEFDNIGKIPNFPPGLIQFSPSSANKCERELFFKAKRATKDEVLRLPLHRRWTRNSTKAHEATQRDLLYCEQLVPNRTFDVCRIGETGLPAWEQNIRKLKKFNVDGVEFLLFGMCDGLLKCRVDGSIVGFEYKTKSTTYSAISYFKLKEPQEDHKAQATAYSLLYGVDEFVFCYETLAKPPWKSTEEDLVKKPDIRTFYHKVTEEDKLELLSRFKRVATNFYNDQVPEGEKDKCIFCQYKTLCESMEGNCHGKNES